MMIQPIINFTDQAGAVHSLFVGQIDTIRAAEAGILTAIREARALGGVDLQLRLIGADGQCIRAFRIPPLDGG